jgi:hypothetical protein
MKRKEMVQILHDKMLGAFPEYHSHWEMAEKLLDLCEENGMSPPKIPGNFGILNGYRYEWDDEKP